MARPRVSPWAALVAVPLLVGAVLLMHGLDAGAHTPSVDIATAAAHDSADHHHRDTACEDCPAPHHLLAACVAVAVTISTVGLARRARRQLAAIVRGLVPSAEHVADRLADLTRAPDPAWVRLSVMRC